MNKIWGYVSAFLAGMVAAFLFAFNRMKPVTNTTTIEGDAVGSKDTTVEKLVQKKNTGSAVIDITQAIAETENVEVQKKRRIFKRKNVKS